MDYRSAASVDSQEAMPLLDTAFRENAAQLYRYIYSKIGSAPLAEDLTSEVFLKATRWLQHDRSADSVRGWLYATARTTIIDHWRQQTQLETLPLDAWEDVLFCGRDPVEETRRTRERAVRLLALLPEREREVLTLCFLCLCHGSRFNTDGRVLSGLARDPLPHIVLRIDGGRVYAQGTKEDV